MWENPNLYRATALWVEWKCVKQRMRATTPKLRDIPYEAALEVAKRNGFAKRGDPVKALFNFIDRWTFAVEDDDGNLHYVRLGSRPRSALLCMGSARKFLK